MHKLGRHRVHPLTVAIRASLYGGEWAFFNKLYQEGLL